MQFTCLKEKIEKKYFSSHKLPKQQLTNFWSQGILEVNSDPWLFIKIHQIQTPSYLLLITKGHL